jgi:hypothetical protein
MATKDRRRQRSIINNPFQVSRAAVFHQIAHAFAIQVPKKEVVRENISTLSNFPYLIFLVSSKLI